VNEGTEIDERGFFAAHAAIAPVQVLRERRFPRHRARRRQWKPPAADALETFQPQHAYDRDAFVR
jgi:hypothetical protein